MDFAYLISAISAGLLAAVFASLWFMPLADRFAVAVDELSACYDSEELADRKRRSLAYGQCACCEMSLPGYPFCLSRMPAGWSLYASQTDPDDRFFLCETCGGEG